MNSSQIVYFYVAFLLFIINFSNVGSRKSVRNSNTPPSGKATPTSPAISAVLLECPKDQPPRRDCERQMMVSISVSPTFEIETLDKFLVLDEVYDQKRQTRAKLMSPYLIEISRGEPVIMYPLQFSKSIRCGSCGHKNDSSTSHDSCEHQQSIASPKVPENKFAAFRNDIGSVAPVAQPSVPATPVAHPARYAVAQPEKEQHHCNEASMGNYLNPRPIPFGKIESQKKLSIGIMDVPTSVELKNSSNVDLSMHPRDRLLYDVNDYGDVDDMEYDANVYDERNLNDDTFAEPNEERAIRTEILFRNKRLKTQPSISAEKQVALSPQNEQLFREAERQSEVARLDTVKAMKHIHPVGTAVGRIAHGADNVRGYESDSRGAVGKPYVAGIHEDIIRPPGEGEFYADGDDADTDIDVNAKVDVDQKRKLGIQSSKYEHQGGSLRNDKVQKLHELNNIPKGESKSKLGTIPERVPHLRKEGKRTHKGSPRENAIPFRSKAVQQPKQRRQKSHTIDSNTYKAKVDDIGIAVGGMDDDFYWNTLNYPRGKAIHIMHNDNHRDKHKDNNKINNNFGNIVELSRHKARPKLSSNNKYSTRGMPPGRAVYKEQGTVKTRSRNAGIDDVDSFVENPGICSDKDVYVPSFPLNGYPGYSKLPISQEYTPPSQHSESIFKILENVPQEYIPHQPPFAKEIGDPNLTAKDKLSLIELLKPSNEYNQTKKKRSPIIYDDLTMSDTYDQYDYFDMQEPIDVRLLDEMPLANSHQSCNDNKCHEKDSKTCTCDRDGRNCKCIPKDEKNKNIRSVSDTWYSVFNTSAPLQFLTLRIEIYRKRHGALWRIAPSITLTSLSGIYANGNLSILFSSHVDILQLKRPLSLENHKLLIPHNGKDIDVVHRNAYESIDPTDILAIDNTKFDFNAIHGDTGTDRNDKDNQNTASAKRSLCRAAISAGEHEKKRHSHSSSDKIFSIGDFGYFPGSMNILEQCPSDPNHLCLNMLDDEVPAFTVKIKQPFRENALVYSGEYKVRIASVISDATTKGALQVAVVLINEALIPHEFAIRICDCPMTCGSKTMVKKGLAPHVSETISFLLPLEENRDKKLYCNVEVKSPDQKVISKRKFAVEPLARCLCIWDCECHCIQSLISHEDYDVCHKLDDYEEHVAGFINDGKALDEELTGWRWFWWRITHYAFSLLIFMLFLGFLKAIVGALVLRRIDRYGYDYVQPLLKYDFVSRCRRFFINLVFFVVLPFIFCCKCFIPTEEELLIASTEWQCSLLLQDMSADGSGNGSGGGGGGRNGGGWKLFKRSHSFYKECLDNDDEEEEETILSQHFESGDALDPEISHSRLSEYLINSCEYDEEDEERDTNYVLQALTESRESIRKLLKSHYSDDLDPSDPLAKKAEELVRRLVAAKIVYRTFDMPLKNVNISIGQKYSIRGYFVPSVGPEYQYFTPSPLIQVRQITANRSSVMVPSVFLRAEEFSRVYVGKLEVLAAGDLSVDPPEDAPCINSLNNANESQLTTTPAKRTSLSPSPSTQPPVGGRNSIANAEVTESQPVPANDVAAESHQIADANNGSDLTTQQENSPKGTI